MNESNNLKGSRVGLLCRLGLGLATVFSVGGPVLAQEDTEVRWHDVRALAATEVQAAPRVDLRLHLSSSYLDRLEPDHLGVWLEDPLRQSADDWLDLVREMHGDELVEAEARSGWWRIVAEERVQEDVAAFVSDLNSHLLRSVELEIFVLPSSVLPTDASPVLGADEVRALLSSAEALAGSRKVTRLGQRLYLGGEGRAAVLMDYDVEVATKARMADPLVTVLREGLSIGAIAQARPGDGFFLRVWGRSGAVERPMRTVQLGPLSDAPLQLPAMRTMLGVSSAAIADGGGLLIGQDWNSDGVWLVRARSTGPELPSHDGRSPFIPLGELAARSLLVPAPRLPQVEPSGGWSYQDDERAQFLESEGSEVPRDLDELRQSLEEEGDRLKLGGKVFLFGDALYVHGSPALFELATHRVQQLTAALRQETASVEVRFGVMDGKLARRLTSGATPEQLAAQLKRRLQGACRLGDSLLVLGGVERFYLKDHDVEIAQAAAIQDPIIGNLFEGVSFWCRPVRVTDNVLSLLVDFAVQTQAGEIVELPVASWMPREPEQKDDDPAPTETFQLASMVELPTTTRGSTSSMVQVAESEWTLLCCTGLPGTDQSLIAVVRVSAE